MRSKLKYNSKYSNELRKILLKHINTNARDYLILSIFFVIGVMAGVILINNSDAQSKAEISGYINSFIETINNEGYVIDKTKLIQVSIIENIKLVAIIWFAGSTVIGIPLIYIITSYKGFCMGYTISAIISSLGIGKRNVIFNFITLSAEYNCNSNYSYALCKCTQVV